MILPFYMNIFSLIFFLLCFYTFQVLYDWNNGKLRYYTEPPEAESEQTTNASVILNEFSSEFDLDSLKLDEEKLFSGINYFYYFIYSQE